MTHPSIMADNKTHKHEHAADVPSQMIGRQAGQDSDRVDSSSYGLNVDWDIDCAACCWIYLTKDRKYRCRKQGDSTQVTFGELPAEGKWTQCFISPKKREHAQFKTSNCKDPTYGFVHDLMLKKGCSFQLYSEDPKPEPTVIGTTVNAVYVVRMESIGVPSVTDQNIQGSCLNYKNAAVLELYRATAKNPPPPPLNGVCEVVSCQAAGMATANVKPKEEIADEFEKLKVK